MLYIYIYISYHILSIVVKYWGDKIKTLRLVDNPGHGRTIYYRKPA